MGLLSSKKPAAPERRSRRTGSEDRLDPAQELRRRARRRLVGAIALVLAAVIILPMLLDSEQAPLPADVPISIPGKTPPPQVAAVPDPATQVPAPQQPGMSPGVPSTTAPSTTVPPQTPGHTVPTTPPLQTAPVTPQQPVETVQPPVRVEPPKPEPKPEPKPAPKPEPKPQPQPRPANEDAEAARARALLEGRPAVVASPSRQQPSKGSFVVQVGAYSTEARAFEVRDKLNGSGVKAFTERVSTGQGDVYRVRVGPYPTREAADSSRDRIKSAGYDSSIVAL